MHSTPKLEPCQSGSMKDSMGATSVADGKFVKVECLLASEADFRLSDSMIS